MKSKSLLILVVAAFFVLSCTISPKTAAKRGDPQTVGEETLVAGIQYSLGDMDREDMDRVFFTNEPVIKQTHRADSEF
jgi:hypothetical protein